jgi:hypothetical protein
MIEESDIQNSGCRRGVDEVLVSLSFGCLRFSSVVEIDKVSSALRLDGSTSEELLAELERPELVSVLTPSLSDEIRLALRLVDLSLSVEYVNTDSVQLLSDINTKTKPRTTDIGTIAERKLLRRLLRIALTLSRLSQRWIGGLGGDRRL